jgi:hypothetical protein
MQSYWIGVASRDHVRRGVSGGFCQLGHGSMHAVRRLSPGDWIVYYSPRSQLDGGEPVQAFTAIGRIAPAEAYQADMGSGFVAGRRDVDFLECGEAPIRPLVDRLGFIANKKNWAYPFRFGLLSVSQEDFRLIAEAMGASLPVLDPTD